MTAAMWDVCEREEAGMISKFFTRADERLNLPFTQEGVGGRGLGDDSLPGRRPFLGV